MRTSVTLLWTLALLTGLLLIVPDRPFADDKPASSVPATAKTASAKPAAETAKPGPPDEVPREIISGKVVLLTEALTRRKIKHYAEEIKDQVVLETADGDLMPILSDWRGRAFYQDERLRNRPVDLVVLRSPGVPHLRVQSIYTFDEEGTRQLTDYWCDLCSIPMYEIKACECCQGETRLRFRPQDLPTGLPVIGKPDTK